MVNCITNHIDYTILKIVWIYSIQVGSIQYFKKLEIFYMYYKLYSGVRFGIYEKVGWPGSQTRSWDLNKDLEKIFS